MAQVAMRYRKRPLEIVAARWFRNGDHPGDGPADREGKIVRYYRAPKFDGETACPKCGSQMHDHGWIDTLEGGHIVCPGDWVITGIKGERYPCKPDIFAATYEPVLERDFQTMLHDGDCNDCPSLAASPGQETEFSCSREGACPKAQVAT